MTSSLKIGCAKLGLVSLSAIAGALAYFGDCAKAQIIPDGTLDANENSRVTTSSQFDLIAGGAKRGVNLFHSFQQFNVGEGRIAYFRLPDSMVENILSRVTGTDPSRIFGKLGVLGNANLFLLNPNGIIFGPNASLDVRGSFVATTANAIGFGNQGFFSASDSNRVPQDLLTVNPTAFFFNQIAARPITINSRRVAPVHEGLKVPDSKSLLLLGGDVSLNQGILQAPGGRVELGGVAGSGTVGLFVDGNNMSLNFPDGVARSNVSLTNAAEVDVTANDGGSIALNARNVDISRKSIFRAGISPLSRPVADAQAGDITLNATGIIKIDNGFIYNAALDTGNAGNLSIDAEQLIIKDGVVVVATVSKGRAGNLTVTASKSVKLTGTLAGGTVPLDIPINPSTVIPVNVPIGLFAASISIDDFIAPELAAELAAYLPESGGDAGNLTIDTGRLIAQGGATVSASTTSRGQGGNLIVNASDSITLSGTSPPGAPEGNLTTDNVIPSGLRNETGGSGPNGDLIINTRKLIIRDGAWVTAGTAGEKLGRTLTVNASDSVELIGTSSVNGIPSVLATGTRRDGDSRDLIINTGRLIVRDGAVLSAGTSSSGQGRNLTVNARDSVELIGTAEAPVNESAYKAVFGNAGVSVFGFVADRPFPSGLVNGSVGDGNAGDLIINTGRLVIRDGAQASVSTTGAGNAGNLIVRASSVEVTGTSADGKFPNALIGPSLLTTAVGPTASGHGGNLIIETGQLIVQNGAQVSAATLGRGNSGDILVKASNSVSLSNSSISTAVNSGAVGNGGDISIEARSLSVIDGAQVSASTVGQGDAGNIEINTASLVELIGANSGLFAQSSATGAAGNLTVTTGQLIVRDGAEVTVSSPQGQAGTLSATTDNIFLEDQGKLTAVTGAGDGGNITLQVQDKLRMRDNSLISAEALGQANGGNIDINADFILAVPSENSDIIATAFEGNGGRINITANVLGIQSREEQTPFSDITASSDYGVDGVVEINTPDVDPSRGLANLPEALVPERLITQGCPANKENTFTITGRGGLPPQPGEALRTSAVMVNEGTLQAGVENRSTSVNSTSLARSTSTQLVEAQGWVLNSQGQVVLIASAPTVTPYSSWSTPPKCHAP